MNGNPDKKKVLYDALTKDGYQLGSFDEFTKKLGDPNKVRALYDGISKDGYDVGDFDTFTAKLGLGASPPAAPFVQAPPVPSGGQGQPVLEDDFGDGVAPASTGSATPVAPSQGPSGMGTRLDGTPKGSGWLGPLKTPDGSTMTELSFDFDVDGRKVFAPLLVPTLDRQEIEHLRNGGEPTDAIYRKAQDFALERIRNGQSPFKEGPSGTGGTRFRLPTEQEEAALDVERGVTASAKPIGQSFSKREVGEAAFTGEQLEKEYAKRLKDRFGMQPREGESAVDTYRSMTAYYDERFSGMDRQGIDRVKAEVEKGTQAVHRIADQWTQELRDFERRDSELEQALPQMSPEEQRLAVERRNAEARRLFTRRGEIEDMENALVRDAQMLALREYEINKETGSGWGVATLVGPQGVGRMTSGVASFIIDGIASLFPAEWVGPEVASGKMTRDQAAKEVKRRMLDGIRKGAPEMTRRALNLETTDEYYQDAAANGPFMARAMIGLGESVPAMASPFMTGIFFQTADAIGQEMEGAEFDDISETEKVALKAAMGIPAMLLERFGFRNLARNNAVTKRILASAVGKLPANATPGQIQRVLDAETRNYLTNFAVRMGGAALAESETGGAQAAADIGVRLLYNAMKERDILQAPETWVDAAYQIGEGAALEAAGAGVLGLPSAISAAARTGSVTKQMTDRQYEMFERLLKDEDYPQTIATYHEELVKSGKITEGQKQKLEEDLRVATLVAQQIPENLPVEARREAFDLLLEKQQLARKDKALSRGRIAEIDARLSELAGPRTDSDQRRDPQTAQAAKEDKTTGTSEGALREEAEEDASPRTPEDLRELVGKNVEYQGREGTIDIDEGGKVTFKTLDGRTLIDLGHESDQSLLDEVSEVPYTNILNEDGTISYGGETFSADIGSAKVTLDDNGDVLSVELETADGPKVITGDAAALLLYENQLRTVKEDADLLAGVQTVMTTDADLKQLIENEQSKEKRRIAKRKRDRKRRQRKRRRDRERASGPVPASQAPDPVAGDGKGWTKQEQDELNALIEQEELDTIEQRMDEFFAANRKYFRAGPNGERIVKSDAPNDVKRQWEDLRDTLAYKHLLQAEQTTQVDDTVREGSRTDEEVGAKPSGQGPAEPPADGPAGEVGTVPATPPVRGAQGEAPAAPSPATDQEAAGGVQVEEQSDVTQEDEAIRDALLMNGQAEKDREAGKRTVAGAEYTRQGEIDAPQGKSGKVQFSEGVDKDFDYVLVEADDLQPSHIGGRRNPSHFIPEAQPKSRTDQGSQLAAQRIAAKPDLGKVGASPNAYSGAPVVNSRGEVVQGNNRAEGLKRHYQNGGKEYKAQLRERAAEFGLTPEQVDGMRNPVLVRRLKVTDAEAIALGNYDAKDIETGGKRRIDPVATSARVPAKTKADVIATLFKDGGGTIKAAVREKFKEVVALLEPYLNPAQRQTLTNKEGQPTVAGMDDIEALVKQFMFDGAPVEFASIVENDLSHAARQGIFQAAPAIFRSKYAPVLLQEVQQAVMAVYEFGRSGVENFGEWATQGDAFRPAPIDRYSPTVLVIAEMLAGATTIKGVSSKLNKYASATHDTEATIFDEAREGLTPEQAAEQEFGVKPRSNERGQATPEVRGADSTSQADGSRAREDGEGGGTPDAQVADGRRGEVPGDEGAAPEVVSFADRVRSLKIDTKGTAGSFIIPPQLWNAAVEAVAKAAEAGAAIADALKAGINAIRQSQWYKNATDKNRKAAIAEFESRLGSVVNEKQPVEKQVKRSTGITKPSDKIVVSERAALKDQLRAMARAAKQGYRAGVQEGRAAGQEEGHAKGVKEGYRAGVQEGKAAGREEGQAKGVMQGYRQGLAEGKLAGEIAGKRAGRKEGTREERARIAQARADFVEAIGEILKGAHGAISPAQAKAIGKAAASVDPTNARQVAKFIDYANRVVDDANWADAVEKARNVRDRAKRMAKSKKLPMNKRDVLKQASEIDPAKLKDPQGYADALDHYMRGSASPTSSKYTEHQLTDGEMMEHIEGWQEEIGESYSDALRDELGLHGIPAKDAKAIYEAIMDGDLDKAVSTLDNKEEVSANIRSMADARKDELAGYDTSDLSKEEADIVRSLAGADLDRMGLSQQADFIRVADNILINGSFAGSTIAAAISDASRSMGPALEVSAKSGVRKALKLFAEQFMSLADAWTFFFGQGVNMAKVQELVGLGEYIRGKQKWASEMKVIREKFDAFYTGLRKKYKDADSLESMTAEWIAGFAIQAMPGMSPAEALEANKRILQEDFAVKEKSLSAKEIDTIRKVYDEVVGGAQSREEVMANLAKKYPAAKASLEFLIESFRPYSEQTQANSVRTWNESGDYGDPYYIPKVFSMRSNHDRIDPNYSGGFDRKTMRPSQAGGTKSRSKYKHLPSDRTINPNVRYNSLNRLSDNLYGVYTDAARMRINEFMRMPEAELVFGNAENKELMGSLIENYITAQDMVVENSEAAKWANAIIDNARGLASIQALGGVTQATRQVPEALSQATILLGRDMPLLFQNIPNAVGAGAEGRAAVDLMGLYAIGSREHAKGGMAWQVRVDELNSLYQKAMASGNVRAAVKARDKIRDIILASLVKGDVLSARAAWLAFYEKARKAQGYKVDSWQTELSMSEDTQRQEAATYADTMVNRMTVSSDPAQAARIAQKGKDPWRNLAKAGLQAFVGTAIQQISRRYTELSTLGAYLYGKARGKDMGEAYDPKRTLMSLTAGLAGNAVFLGSRIWVATAVRDMIGDLYKWFVDDDEDEEPSIKAKVIYAFMTAMYMMGMMDADVFRAVDKVERERGRKPNDPDSEAIKKYKLFRTQMLSEFVGSSIWQMVDDAFVDGLNYYMGYLPAIEAGDPNVFTKSGKPKAFREWLRDPQNAPFYRYGQTQFIDRNRVMPDMDNFGVFGVMVKNSSYLKRNIDNIFGKDEEEYGTPYQKMERERREAMQKRTEALNAVMDKYQSGEIPPSRMSIERAKFIREYGKEAGATWDRKKRYIDAPDEVKEILDINSTEVRAKAVRDKMSGMRPTQRDAYKRKLKEAGVWTPTFEREYKSLKSSR